MNPVFFGEAEHALYGVHHPPRGATPRSAGVLLCYPFAQEYMRAHRAFRQLSLLLSAEGFHVLRFDYTGTGDSAGDPVEMSLERWDQDLGLAIEELIDTAAVASVWIIGLRLGGALALRAAARAEVNGVVLWDPIVFGEEQLEEATALSEAEAAGMIAVGGVPIAPALRRELAGMDLTRDALPVGCDVLLAVSSDEDRFGSLRDRLARDGVQISYVCVPSDGRWSYFDNWGSALIPQGLIRTIVNHLKGVVR